MTLYSESVSAKAWAEMKIRMRIINVQKVFFMAVHTLLFIPEIRSVKFNAHAGIL